MSNYRRLWATAIPGRIPGIEGDLTPMPGTVILKAPPIREKDGSLFVPPEAEWYQKQLKGEVVAKGRFVDERLIPGTIVAVHRFRRVALANDGSIWVQADADVVCAFNLTSEEHDYIMGEDNA